MRAGWILLEIRHKQYEVNVDEVGADSIRPPYCATTPGSQTGRYKSAEQKSHRQGWPRSMVMDLFWGCRCGQECSR